MIFTINDDIITFIVTIIMNGPAYNLEIYEAGVKTQLSRMYKLFFTKDVMLLSLVFFYNGLEFIYYWGQIKLFEFSLYRNSQVV